MIPPAAIETILRPFNVAYRQGGCDALTSLADACDEFGLPDIAEVLRVAIKNNYPDLTPTDISTEGDQQ